MSDWDERHPREPDPGEGVRIIGPQGDPRGSQDRGSQDDPRRWGGGFSDTQPRWRDEPEQGFPDPTPGRSVFGDAPAAPAETYEDAYRDQSYDDRGRGGGDQPADPNWYADQTYTDQQQPQQQHQPPPPPPQPQHQPPPPPRPGPGYEEGYDQRYDAGYDDSGYGDVYQDAAPGQRAFAEPPPSARPTERPQRVRRGPSLAAAGGRDMRVAIGVGVGLVVAALVVFKIGPVATMVLAIAVLGMASFEYFTATQRAGFDPLMPVGVAATVAAVIAAYNYGQSAIPLVLVMSVAVCTVWYLIGAGGERPMANVGATLLGICWIGLMGSYAGLLLAGDYFGEHGITFLLAAIVPTVGYDVGALFVGSKTGSRPLSTASPNKTLEGLGGGMMLAVVGGCLLGVIGVHPIDSLGEGLVIGLVAAIAAPLGDLSESLIKRDLGIKDMGTLLPGHGGVLDRFDGLLFVLPAIWYTLIVKDFFL